MALIKIIRGGCGVNLVDANGRERYALKTPEDKPFECEEAQASRFVGLGVAEYVGIVPESADIVPDTADIVPEDEPKPLDESQLEAMTIEQLKNLAGDIGADVSGCKKKADYIAAIMEFEDDGEELPELDAADPE
ncbi:MAG: hypothetical protein J6S14_08940 [Clostridia bacterium]|nr:hypothetical protein [Clostridia bacterium]